MISLNFINLSYYDANRSFNLVVLVSEPRGKYYIEEVYFYNEDGIRWEDKYCARNDLVIVPSINPSNPYICE